MQFRCEDLRDAGVVLIAHDSQSFERLATEITRHVESPPLGGPPPIPGDKLELPDPDDPASAILWNGSGKPICAYTLVWKPGGNSILGVGSMPSLLLPFGLTDERRAFVTYWQTILPDSKRWLGRERVVGSNADIRPPAGDEVWHGGVMRWGGNRNGRPQREPDTVTLTIDAVFFATGECAGPDTHQLWEQIVFPAEVAQQIARAARQGVESGLNTNRILSNVEQITGVAQGRPGPPPLFGSGNPHEFQEWARQQFANWIATMRKTGGDEKTVATLNGWADARVPEFRRI